MKKSANAMALAEGDGAKNKQPPSSIAPAQPKQDQQPQKSSGRPPFIKHTPLLIWVLVELMRDQQDPGRKRKSERDGCNRLQKKLAEEFIGGRVLPFDTIRRYYRNFKTTIRRSNSGSEKALADILLRIGRARRALLGWNASVSVLVFDPELLEVQAAAYLLSIDPKLLSFDPNELMTH